MSSFWRVNEDSLLDGKVGFSNGIATASGRRSPRSRLHKIEKSGKGKTISGLIDRDWHTWLMCCNGEGCKFWRDYVDSAKPYFNVLIDPYRLYSNVDDIRWLFNNPCYWMIPTFTMVVGGLSAGYPP